MEKQSLIMADLLTDLFSFYKTTLGFGNTFESYTGGAPEITEVISLLIPHCPPWARPALGIKTMGYGNNVLTLFGVAPSPGINSELSGRTLTFHSSCSGKNVLWTAPDGSLDGMSRIQVFRKEDEGLALFAHEVLGKALELFYSGKYNNEYLKLEEKVVV